MVPIILLIIIFVLVLIILSVGNTFTLLLTLFSVLLLAGLFIGKRLFKKHKCKCSHDISDVHDSTDDDSTDLEDLLDNIKKEPELPAKKKSTNKSTNSTNFDIALYNGADIPELHRQMGCTADNKIANRMKYMGMQSKLSADIRARYNARSLLGFFDEELRANEARDWWDNENDVLDNYM